jgi:hypothetical protein
MKGESSSSPCRRCRTCTASTPATTTTPPDIDSERWGIFE